MQPKQNMAIPGEDDNASEYFRYHEDEEYLQDEQDIEEDH